MGKRRQRPRRKTGASLNLVLEKKTLNKYKEPDSLQDKFYDNLDEDELREIAKNELGTKWKYLDTEYYNTEYNIRYVNDLDEAFIPSIEYLNNIESFILQDYYYEQLIQNPKYKNLSYKEYEKLVRESAQIMDNETTKDLLELFIKNGDNYHLTKDKNNNYYLEANDKKVNADPKGDQYVEEYSYKIYFMNTGKEERNLFDDGNLVKPKEVIAVFNQDEDRFLTAHELKKVKFSDKGAQPKIYQLEGMK